MRDPANGSDLVDHANAWRVIDALSQGLTSMETPLIPAAHLEDPVFEEPAFGCAILFPHPCK